MKRILSASAKTALCILLAVLSAVLLTELSPVYDFEEPHKFQGPDIFNPYEGLDTATFWKRSNFHTHTRVDNILNECPEYPAVVYEDYMKLGYDVLAFSNHNLLTKHPVSDSLQINVYEHGINLFKFHKLVFNPGRMILHDVILPVTVSQKQFEYDYLGRNADFIVMNHPDRTNGMTARNMRLLTGYRLIEADSGASTGLERWDEALSAGHYSFCITDDDCHDSGNHARIAIRCNWLDADSANYEEVKDVLLSGRFYSMRVPDFGGGDWNVKYEKNSCLPYIRDIGMEGDSVYISLSSNASFIKVTGQGHVTLDSLANVCSMSYRFRPEDSYARFTACFDDGTYIYTNPFARYDKRNAPSPYTVSEHSLNLILTLLFNIAVLFLAGLCIFLAIRLFSRKKHEA